MPERDYAKAMQPGQLAALDTDDVIARIAAGASLREIAGQIGCSQVGLRARLLRTDGDAYRAALDAQIAERLANYAELADESVREICEVDPEDDRAQARVNIARGRADVAESAARHWRWIAERRSPERWGDKRQVQHQHGGSVEVVMRPGISRAEWLAEHAQLRGSGVMVNHDAPQHPAIEHCPEPADKHVHEPESK